MDWHSRALLASCRLRAPGGTPVSVGRTCRVRGTTGGAKGLPSVVLGVRPGGTAAACVAVGERLLAINGEPVTDHEAASQLLRAATGEVVPPHGNSTLPSRPQLPSWPCDLCSASAPPRGAPGGSGRPEAPGRVRPEEGCTSRPPGRKPQCESQASLPTHRSPPGTAHRTRRCREHARRPRRRDAAGGATFAADVWHCSS